jgi:hypothetical protein
MAWPATIEELPGGVQNQTDVVTGEPDPDYSGPDPEGEGDHAARHNALPDAINRTWEELGVNPSGGSADVAARLDAIGLVLATHTEGLTAAGAAIAAESARAEAAEALLQSRKAPDLLLPGDFVPTGTWQSVAFVVVGSRTYYARYVPSKDRVITKMVFGVTGAATANDKCELAISNSTGVRQVITGQKEGLLNAGGIKTVTLAEPFAVKAGTIYFPSISIGPLGGTGATILGVANNNGLSSDMMGTATMATRLMPWATGFPTPAGPPVIGGSTPGPFMALLE